MSRPVAFLGDVHGHFEALEALLKRIPDRFRIVFLGDLVDRGPEVRRVVERAMSLERDGRALCLLGNHEYNALAWDWPHPQRPGDWVRAHDTVNARQLAGTHREFPEEGRGELVGWIRTLPVFLENAALRAVHATWDPRLLDVLKEDLVETTRNGFEDFTLWVASGRAFFDRSAVEGSPLRKAFYRTIKGVEHPLPDGFEYADADGHPRKKVRIAWWKSPGTWVENGHCPEEIAARLDGEGLPFPAVTVDPDPRPVFFGHYWLKGRPRLQSPLHACLDFSVAKGGCLCAYLWEGETELRPEHLVWTDAAIAGSVGAG